MFQVLRDRLLRSYVLVFASILSVSAIAVRVVFTHILSQQFTEKLVALGESAAASLELEDGDLVLENDFSVQSSLDGDQALEWFDARGRSIGKQGRYVLTLPLARKKIVQTQAGTPPIRGMTLPLTSQEDHRLVGYVRASQSLEDFEETLRKLDWGLGSGAIVALLLGGMGGAILTRQAMQPVEQSFDRLKQFTADASHELRNPLMAIDANVQVALKYPEEISVNGIQKFEAIANATAQMLRLTEDLLFLARTDRDLELDRTIFDLTDLLSGLLQLYQQQAQTKSIQLSLFPGKPIYLRGDVAQLKQLFANLLVNALCYTPEGGKVEMDCARVEKHILVRVKDTGIGIAPENLERVFDRFWQADSSRSYRSGGSGLGLAIARAIAQNHGGSIAVTSQLGVGSCFTVKLPAIDPSS
ncbi:MAG: sensor histidine kinase [Cyanobacteria bacterium J055]|nr:MAG: sensor histidine kinase [Cyanobacteria bacterium J055]